MLRIVLDTNVLVSAALTRHGNEAEILDALRHEKFQLVLSPQILEEMKRVLFYQKIKKRRWMSDAEVEELLTTLETLALIVPGQLDIKVVRDPSDDKFVIAAVEGNASYIVTGDPDLREIKSYTDIKVISPAEFVRILETQV